MVNAIIKKTLYVELGIPPLHRSYKFNVLKKFSWFQSLKDKEKHITEFFLNLYYQKESDSSKWRANFMNSGHFPSVSFASDSGPKMS